MFRVWLDNNLYIVKFSKLQENLLKFLLLCVKRQVPWKETSKIKWAHVMTIVFSIEICLRLLQLCFPASSVPEKDQHDPTESGVLLAATAYSSFCSAINLKPNTLKSTWFIITSPVWRHEGKTQSDTAGLSIGKNHTPDENCSALFHIWWQIFPHSFLLSYKQKQQVRWVV